MAECVYLGYVVGREVVRPELSKVEQYKILVNQPQGNKQEHFWESLAIIGNLVPAILRWQQI